MIYHVVAQDDWLAVPDRPYAPSSLREEGFVHCSPDERTALAIASTLFRDAAGPLLALVIDESGLGAPVRWETGDGRPPAEAGGRPLFPHVYGEINREAVTRVTEVERDAEGRATRLIPR
ncbi:DUF952 domain-containing protein [Streptomyces durbertensis]|uniref:DUF952 domain-containing protein n=1 Tax=Streptomyces durbertensis TaxID=2448886 RepID=A0ABR6EF87_9ACTN|nr:DUF952 domain-containing protein [Streptomyces durbertensis]MBB1243994.1 DUF952 domain-containing protein [Streptomyces durbertensis]